MAEKKDLVLKQIGNYRFLGKTLGKGNFARVELAEHKLTGIKVAVKVINVKTIKEHYVRRNILREAMIMKKINHENVIKLYETLKYDCVYCLVTELVKGGDLRSYVHHQKNKKLTEGRARSFFRQLLSAVQHLHESGIVHRDLKMDNILLDETKTVVKIVDFGLSNVFNKGELLRTHCGSPEYAAPELFEKGCLYGPSVDFWSMGVILYAMVIGHLPFSSIHHGFVGKDELYRYAKKGLSFIHEKYLGKISNGCSNLLTNLLQPDPAKRISLEHMKHHFWVTDEGKAPLVKTPTLLIPKNVRNQIIDRVAMLCCKSVPELEALLHEPRHDSVGATYNLLLNEATKDVKAMARLRSKTSQSVPSQKSPDSIKTMSNLRVKENGKREGKEHYLKSQSGKKAEVARKANGSDEKKVETKPSSTNSPVSYESSSPKSPFSSVKIVEFKDAMNLEGRGHSPIIRKPKSVARYRKGYSPCGSPNQFRRVKQVFPEKGKLETAETKVSNEYRGKIFCGEFPEDMGKTCRITKFPEEEKSVGWPKLEGQSSELDAKQMMYAVGYGLSSLPNNTEEDTSPRRLTRSFHGPIGRNRKEKPQESKSFESAMVQACKPRAKTAIEARGFLKSDVRRRSIEKGTHMRGIPVNARSIEQQQKGTHMKVGRERTIKNSMLSRVASERNSINKRRCSGRFGIAVSQLQGSASDSRVKERESAMVNRRNSLCKNDILVEEWKCKSDSREFCIDNKVSKDEMKRVSEFQTVSTQNDAMQPKPDKHGEGPKIGEENTNNENDQTDDGHVVATRCQSISFFDEKRKASLGILKVPSRCSSADFVSGIRKERKGLKVTFQDEVAMILHRKALSKAKQTVADASD